MILTKSFSVSFAGAAAICLNFTNATGAVVSCHDRQGDVHRHSPLFSRQDPLSSIRVRRFSSVAEIEHPIVRECLSLLGIECGMEIASFADVPAALAWDPAAHLLSVFYMRSTRAPANRESGATCIQACEIELNHVTPIGRQTNTLRLLAV